ncbi:Meiosis-specific protein ASY1 [Glycine soja]
MVVAQKVKDAEITEQDSLLLTRNLLRIAIFNISYIRGLFPEKYFNDKSVPALGVYDALQKKYLKTLLFCVCEAVDGPMIEEYAFSFSYSNSDNQEVSMNINRTGSKKNRGTFKYNSTTEITPQQMRSSACKMIRTLVQLMRTLEKMPEERTILMKLLYYDDVTPADYEPPFFKGCTDEEAYHPWEKNPLKMEVGNVNSKHFVLALKVKSVLDPCEDDNEGIQDDLSAGDDSMQQNEYYDTDSEVDLTQGNRYIVAPIHKEQEQEENGMIDEDNTQDPVEDEQQLVRVKEWINCCHRDTIELNDVLSNFPDISVVLTEGMKVIIMFKLFCRFYHLQTLFLFRLILLGSSEIMEKLVEEGVLSKTGKETYAINKDKKLEYEFPVVKEEIDGQIPQAFDRGLQFEDRIYMKALYHVLPMTHVSLTKLQSLLEGEVNQTAGRKILDKMVRDGFVEPKGSKRLGIKLRKRVIHSELTERKFIEVQKALSATEAMDVDHCEPNSKFKKTGFHLNGSNYDVSTCGVLHSIGSDLTRMKVTSETNYSDSGSGQKTIKAKEPGNTPISRPVISRESFAQGKENGRTNGIENQGDEADTIICSKSSQDKRPRKTSAVKEPINQNMKRQRSEAQFVICESRSLHSEEGSRFSRNRHVASGNS